MVTLNPVKYPYIFLDERPYFLTFIEERRKTLLYDFLLAIALINFFTVSFRIFR